MTPGGRANLAQRLANTQARRAGPCTAGAHGKRPADWADVLREPAPRPSPVVPVVKHCWYDGPYGRQAALLLEWRRIEGGYDGRILVAAPDSEAWGVVEMWVESGMLSPA